MKDPEAVDISPQVERGRRPLGKIVTKRQALVAAASLTEHNAQEAYACPNTVSSILIRFFDLIVASLAIMILLPLMVLLVIGIRTTSSGPAFFCQHRVGRNGKLFPCLKFRTMLVDAQFQLEALLERSELARAEWALNQKLRNDPHITPLGELLRRTSLDELPQLFNIVVGQMSIVGPRPIVESEIARYGSRFAHYCSVRPGLTGLWQASGRNNISYARRIRLDSFYARRQCFRLNLVICLKTVPAVLGWRRVY